MLSECDSSGASQERATFSTLWYEARRSNCLKAKGYELTIFHHRDFYQVFIARSGKLLQQTFFPVVATSDAQYISEHHFKISRHVG